MTKLVKTDSAITVARSFDVIKALGREELAEVAAPTIVMIDGGSYFADRSDWARGPWDSEPDRVEWRSGGVPCLANRGPMGSWCGYVGVSEGHPWYARKYDTIDADVHGGVTYCAECDNSPRGTIRLTRLDGEPACVWWVGFDCGHLLDLGPRFNRFKSGLVGGRLEPQYRDLEYVRAEVERLAQQARAAR